ncbi:MAG: sulfur carrier protein ThiS adenylyltransferase ThiF [Raoultibacter sp.]
METGDSRFGRVLMERVSPERYEKLLKARVGIAGLGGIGSHIAIQLARCGVGSLHLVDFDRVDAGNLNRQHYFSAHEGRLKTEALREQILQINPRIRLICDSIIVTRDNAGALFEDDPIVCEAFDRPENKALLVNALLEQSDSVKVIASSGMAGLGPSNDIRTQRIGSRLYVCGDGVSDVAAGEPLFAPRVAICAGHQSQQAIRLILEED